jgi:hypothetical protein
MSDDPQEFRPPPAGVDPHLVHLFGGQLRVVDGVCVLDAGINGRLVLWRDNGHQVYVDRLVQEGKVPEDTILEGQRVFVQLHFLDVPWGKGEQE